MQKQNTQLAELVNGIKTELIRISPSFSSAFQDPATPHEIEKFIRQIGPVIPTELISFYEISKGGVPDGPCAFAYSLELVNMIDCIRRLRQNIDIAEEFADLPLTLEYADEQIDSTYEYGSTRIPLASATRLEICIDLSPTEHGSVGQVIFIDSEYKVGIWLAESLAAFLETFHVDLKNDYYEIGKYSNDFLSCKTEISLSNWQWSQRWSHVPFDRSTLAPIED